MQISSPTAENRIRICILEAPERILVLGVQGPPLEKYGLILVRCADRGSLPPMCGSDHKGVKTRSENAQAEARRYARQAWAWVGPGGGLRTGRHVHV